jgi:arylsulfatase A-like enzyme
VSLVDVPPTLAELAGLARRSDWQGHSLLRPLPARSLYAFECDRNPSTSTLAAFDGRRKVMAYESLEALRAGRLVAAFDQEHDPAERENLATHAPWPAETLAAALPTLERLLVPLVTIATADLSPEKQAELRALGYGGGDD